MLRFHCDQLLAPGFLGALVLLGCGDKVYPEGPPPITIPPEPEPFPTEPLQVPALDVSGTRLRSIRVTVDGRRHHVGWFDSQLNVPCVFTTATDGRARCLPIGTPVDAAFQNSCEDPALPADPACTGSFVLASTGRGYAVRRVGAPIAISAVHRSGRGPDGTLACLAEPLESAIEVFGPGELLPPEMFVAQSPGPRFETGSRLVYLQAVGDDGSKQADGVHDQQLGERCQVRTGPGKRLYCFPSAALILDHLYADGGCTARAVRAWWAEPDPSPRRFGYRMLSPGCDFAIEMYGIGEPVADNVVYERKGGGCVAAAPAPGARYHVVDSQPAGPGEFEELQLLPTQGRLGAREYISRGGVLVGGPQPTLWLGATFSDLQKHQPCRFLRTGDGNLRCVPLPARRAFFDSACTAPAIQSTRSICNSYFDQATVLEGPWCAPIARVFDQGPVVDRVFERTFDGRCVPIVTTDLYYRGVPRADSEFAAGEQTIE